MAKVGRPKSDNPKKDRITIRFHEDQLNRLEEYAEKYKMTKSELLTKALNEFLENRFDSESGK